MLADELDEHLSETLDYIRRHRAQVILGGQGFSDVPAFSGFKAKAPCNDSAVEAADMEAVAIGRLAVYCINMGTIPDVPMAGFWFSRGKVAGLKTSSDWDEYTDGEHNGKDVLAHLQPFINHLRTWAPAIVRTPGVESYLEACAKIRRYSRFRHPNEVDEWLTLPQAAKRFDISEGRLQNLMYAGSIKFLSSEYGDVLISSESVKFFKHATMIRRIRGAEKARLSRLVKKCT